MRFLKLFTKKPKQLWDKTQLFVQKLSWLWSSIGLCVRMLRALWCAYSNKHVCVFRDKRADKLLNFYTEVTTYVGACVGATSDDVVRTISVLFRKRFLVQQGEEKK